MILKTSLISKFFIGEEYSYNCIFGISKFSEWQKLVINFT